MRVLLADDQPQVRSALRLLLEHEAEMQVVDEVTNTEDLLAQAQATSPDVLLLDWELPGLPATILLATLRKGYPHLAVIALSGQLEARRAALAAGADAFISKSDPADQLLTILREMGRKEHSMYKKILVPLDGSERAEAILPHVREIAHRYSAGVILLRVIEPYLRAASDTLSAIPNPKRTEREIQNAETYLAIRRGKLREAGIADTKIQVSQGPVVEVIINTAERENVDLIAMASHGRTGLSRVFYGSVAAGVLHRVDRPLLLVRTE